MNHTHVADNNICYNEVIPIEFRWPGDVPAIVMPLPTLVLQMTISIFVNHGLYLILQYLHQPRIVADILTCFALSPATLTKLTFRHVSLDRILYPPESVTVLETVGNLGLLYAMFVQGLQVELTVLSRKTTRSLTLAYTVFLVPFTVGCVIYLVSLSYVKHEAHIHNIAIECLCWGTITATTTFQTLAPFLPRLKLLCTDIGREALSSGMINGVLSWYLIFFTLALSAAPSDIDRYSVDMKTTGWVLLSMVLFVFFCCFAVRPVIVSLISDVAEGEAYPDSTIQFILFLVIAFGLIGDLIGSHFIFGAFLLGMSIPNGVSSVLIEKIEDCVLGIFMPLYFTATGTRLNIFEFLHESQNIYIALVAIFCKALCTTLIAPLFNMYISDGMGLGVLLSAKGLLPLIVIDIVCDRGHMSTASFTSLVLVLLVSSMMIGPIMTMVYKRIKNTSQTYDQRTIEGTKLTDEFRIMTCLQSPRNAPSILNLMEITSATNQTPVSVFALHLVEQVGHAPAMLIEHEASEAAAQSMGVKPMFNRIRAHSEQIITAFHEYLEQNNTTTFFQILTVVSPVDSMHEDICNLAENKEVNFIILSFHKQQGVDGKLEDTNIEFRAVNQNVLSASPCSVGLLIDRGLRLLSSSLPTTMRTGSSGRTREYIEIAMVYIGGPDDREALTYAWRMSGHPFVSLTVIRFLVGENPIDCQPSELEFLNDNDEQVKTYTFLTQNDKERQIDEVFLNTFQQKAIHDSSIYYKELISNNGEETIRLLRDIHRDYDLYIVGMGDGIVTPLTAGLAEWSDCPELGAMGDVLTTSDFSMNTSVLVIRQYKRKGKSNSFDEDDDKALTSSFERQP